MRQASVSFSHLRPGFRLNSLYHTTLGQLRPLRQAQAASLRASPHSAPGSPWLLIALSPDSRFLWPTLSSYPNLTAISKCPDLHPCYPTQQSPACPPPPVPHTCPQLRPQHGGPFQDSLSPPGWVRSFMWALGVSPLPLSPSPRGCHCFVMSSPLCC